MDSSQLRQRLGVFSRNRRQIERALLAFRDPFVEGSLYLRYMRCSKTGCQCEHGKKHGPFYYMSVKKKGRTVHHYIGKRIDTGLAKQLSRYKQFQDKLRELRQVERQSAKLWAAFRVSLIKRKG